MLLLGVSVEVRGKKKIHAQNLMKIPMKCGIDNKLSSTEVDFAYGRV